MWPIGHVALGYLLFSGYVHVRYRRAPRRTEAGYVLLGSLLPDVIDKPLALVGVFPDGRFAAHSLFVALVFTVLVAAVSPTRLGQTGTTVAFGLSYLSHLLADGLPMFIESDFAEDFAEVSHWFWPLPDPSGKLAGSSLNESVTEAKGAIGRRLWFSDLMDVQSLVIVVELGVIFLGLVAWMVDGKPGWPRSRHSEGN